MPARSAKSTSTRTTGERPSRPSTSPSALLVSLFLLLSPLSANAQPDSARPIGAPAPARESAALPAPGASNPTSPASLARTGLSLAIVLGIALALAAGAKRLGKSGAKGTLLAQMGPGGPSPSGLLEVLGRYPFTRQHTLVVLRFDQRVLLLSQTRGARGGSSLATLCTVDDPEGVASILLKAQDDDGSSAAARFRDLIDRFDGGEGDGVSIAGASEPDPHDRRVQESDGGDRAELLDERSLLFPRIAADDSRPTSPDAVGSLRRRLAGMRGDEPGERGAPR